MSYIDTLRHLLAEYGDRNFTEERAALTRAIAVCEAYEGAEKMEETECCGRQECGGECGNYWRGVKTFRIVPEIKETP